MILRSRHSLGVPWHARPPSLERCPTSPAHRSSPLALLAVALAALGVRYVDGRAADERRPAAAAQDRPGTAAVRVETAGGRDGARARRRSGPPPGRLPAARRGARAGRGAPGGRPPARRRRQRDQPRGQGRRRPAGRRAAARRGAGRDHRGRGRPELRRQRPSTSTARRPSSSTRSTASARRRRRRSSPGAPSTADFGASTTWARCRASVPSGSRPSGSACSRDGRREERERRGSRRARRASRPALARARGGARGGPRGRIAVAALDRLRWLRPRSSSPGAPASPCCCPVR